MFLVLQKNPLNFFFKGIISPKRFLQMLICQLSQQIRLLKFSDFSNSFLFPSQNPEICKKYKRKFLSNCFVFWVHLNGSNKGNHFLVKKILFAQFHLTIYWERLWEKFTFPKQDTWPSEKFLFLKNWFWDKQIFFAGLGIFWIFTDPPDFRKVVWIRFIFDPIPWQKKFPKVFSIFLY